MALDDLIRALEDKVYIGSDGPATFRHVVLTIPEHQAVLEALRKRTRGRPPKTNDIAA